MSKKREWCIEITFFNSNISPWINQLMQWKKCTVQKREDVREMNHLIPSSPSAVSWLLFQIFALFFIWVLLLPWIFSSWFFNLSLYLCSPCLSSCLITSFSIAMLLIHSHSVTGQRMCWKKAHLFWSEHCRWYSASQDKAWTFGCSL